MIFVALTVTLITCNLPYNYTPSQDKVIVAPSIPTLNAPQSELDLFSTDKRLDKKLSMFQASITVKDFVALLEAETGAAFHLSASDEDQERKLCLRLNDTPVRSVLYSLSAMFSYTQARWRWTERTDEQGQTYYLPSAPDETQKQKLVDAAKQKVKTSFEKAAFDSAKVLDYSDENLKKYGGKGSEYASMPNKSPENIKYWRDGMRIFHNVLSSEQQQAVLAGESVTLDERVSPLITTFIDSDWQNQKALGGTRPDSVTFEVVHLPNAITPVLVLYYGRFGGRNFVGGPMNETAWRTNIGTEWFTRYDAKDNLSESATIPELTLLQAEDEKKLPGNIEPVPHLVWRLSETTNTPIMALLRDDVPGVSVTYIAPDSPLNELPYNKPFGKLVSSLDFPGVWYAHKWNSDILLLRNPIEPFTMSTKEKLEQLRLANEEFKAKQKLEQLPPSPTLQNP